MFTFIKRRLIDLVGFSLIILAGLTGWIPGPGGLPLLFAGLAVLAINHEWARKWLKKAKTSSLNLSERIFVDHPTVKIALDIAGLALLLLAVYLLNSYTKVFIKSLAVSAGFLGLSLFLGNRKRLKRFINWFKTFLKRK